jgi:sec-independent protein translocase protein TatB
MEILGIGAPELIFIIIIALIVLGPKDMEKAGKSIGRWLNQLFSSDGWRAFQRTSRELRNLPINLMRQANLDELKETGQDIQNAIDPNWKQNRPSPDIAQKRLKTDSSRTSQRDSVSPTEAAPESNPANPPDDLKPDA